MTSIYELTADIQELETRLEAAETSEHVPHYDYVGSYLYLEEQEDRLAQKIDAYVAVYRDLQARCGMRKAEARHLMDMAKTDENNMDRLKEAIKYVSEQLGRSKLQGVTRSITVSSSSRPAIEIVDEEAVPVAFKEAVTTWKIDKKAIADLMVENGEVVDGVKYKTPVTVRFN
jgi:hypothetical protein